MNSTKHGRKPSSTSAKPARSTTSSQEEEPEVIDDSVRRDDDDDDDDEEDQFVDEAAAEREGEEAQEDLDVSSEGACISPEESKNAKPIPNKLSSINKPALKTSKSSSGGSNGRIRKPSPSFPSSRSTTNSTNKSTPSATPSSATNVKKPATMNKKKFEIPASHLPGDAYHETIEKLQNLYKRRIKDLEEKYLFNRFGYEELTDQQLEAKAQILLLGQYSTGKTTMIRYLLGREYMGLHVGPEPTTDRFVAIVYGEVDDIIQGKVLTENPTLPFKETETFAGFTGKFNAARCPAEVLKSLTLIDTPGVLSGEKQKTREYDYRIVTKWFASRSDLILLLFDPSKLDISDELKQIIGDLKTSSSKVRIVLNKADTLDRSALTRVYGALMWSMGKILETPEVVRVFIGSFWEKPNKYQDPIFVEDEAALMNELENLPHNVPKQRINNLADRVGVLKFYLHLMVAIRHRLSMIPLKVIQDASQQAILSSLPEIIEEVLLKQRKKLAHKDVPKVDVIKSHLVSFKSLHELPRPTASDLHRVEMILEQDIPRLIAEVDGTFSILHGGPKPGESPCTPRVKSSNGGITYEVRRRILVTLFLTLFLILVLWGGFLLANHYSEGLVLELLQESAEHFLHTVSGGRYGGGTAHTEL